MEADHERDDAHRGEDERLAHRRHLPGRQFDDRGDGHRPEVHHDLEPRVDRHGLGEEEPVCDLLAERTAYDEDGHHYGVYVATVERATVEFDAGQLRVTVDRRRPEAPADRLTELFENLR